MRNEFTAVVERAGRWHIAYCPEIPGANGQGRTKAAALKSLSSAAGPPILDVYRRRVAGR
jgi:predicted RNase H-like HicB family nuclease